MRMTQHQQILEHDMQQCAEPGQKAGPACLEHHVRVVRAVDGFHILIQQAHLFSFFIVPSW